MLNTLAMAIAAALGVQPNVDSVYVGRRVMETPHHVTMRKESLLTTGDFFRAVADRLHTDGYFDVTSASLANMCGDPDANVNRWIFRVHADGAWHDLVVRDDCVPSSESLQTELATLRRLAGDVIAGHLRPAAPPHG